MCLSSWVTTVISSSCYTEDRKAQKYHAFLQEHVFIPLALETMGPISAVGLDFISDLGHRLTLVSREQRETSYLFHRLSIYSASMPRLLEAPSSSPCLHSMRTTLGNNNNNNNNNNDNNKKKKKKICVVP